MAIFVFILGAALTSVSLFCLIVSLDLLPTEMGHLWAQSGVTLLAASAIVVAIGVLIAKLDQIVSPKPKPKAAEPEPEDINLNREGEIPSAQDFEDAAGAPEAEARVIGRYSAGGAHYLVYSDGGIEAETEAGVQRFSSMDEFRAYIAQRRA